MLIYRYLFKKLLIIVKTVIKRDGMIKRNISYREFIIDFKLNIF